MPMRMELVFVWALSGSYTTLPTRGKLTRGCTEGLEWQPTDLNQKLCKSINLYSGGVLLSLFAKTSILSGE